MLINGHRTIMQLRSSSSYELMYLFVIPYTCIPLFKETQASTSVLVRSAPRPPAAEQQPGSSMGTSWPERCAKPKRSLPGAEEFQTMQPQTGNGQQVLCYMAGTSQ